MQARRLVASLMWQGASRSATVLGARGCTAATGVRSVHLWSSGSAVGSWAAAAPRTVEVAASTSRAVGNRALSLWSSSARQALTSIVSVRGFHCTSPALRPHKLKALNGRDRKPHKGCLKRFKVTGTGKVRYFPAGGRHHKYKLSGRQVQKKRKPRYLNSVDGKKIKIAMLQGRNWTPAWPKRFRLRLKSELTPEELADRAAKAAFAANGYK